MNKMSMVVALAMLVFVGVMGAACTDRETVSTCQTLALCLAESERPIVSVEKTLSLREIEDLSSATPALVRTAIEGRTPIDLAVRIKGLSTTFESRPDYPYVLLESDPQDRRWEAWGGIAEGMSGSPVIVYVRGEWRLIAAVSVSIGPGRELPPYPMVATPIEYMLPLFAAIPLDDSWDPAEFGDIEPGSPIAEALMMGPTVEAMAGTMTAIREDGAFLALGHAFLKTGAVALPLSVASVDAIVRDPKKGAQKVFSVTNDVIGRVEADTWVGIAGHLGRGPDMASLHASVAADGRPSVTYAGHIAHFSPNTLVSQGSLLAGFVENAVQFERGTISPGSSVVELVFRVQGGHEASRTRLLSSGRDIGADISDFVQGAANELVSERLLFDGSAQLESMDVTLEVTSQRREATIVDCEFDPSQLQKGQPFPVRITLIQWGAGYVDHDIVIDVPFDFPSGPAQIRVAPADDRAFQAEVAPPAATLDEAVDRFNAATARSDVLVVMLKSQADGDAVVRVESPLSLVIRSDASNTPKSVTVP